MGNSRFKFRVWENARNCYLKDEKTAIIGDGDLIYGDMITNATQLAYGADNPNIIVEQSTGLRDKNGNLIYENDVLFDGEFCGQVIWKDGCWLVEMTLYDGDKSYEHLDQHFAKYGEITGTIHEQKENK